MVDVKAIRARAEAATKGPWFADKEGIGGIGAYSCWLGVGPQGDALGRCFDVAHVEALENADFIAAARSDVPALCDEVDRLRKALGDLCDYERQRHPPKMGGDHYPPSLRDLMTAASAALEGS